MRRGVVCCPPRFFEEKPIWISTPRGLLFFAEGPHARYFRATNRTYHSSTPNCDAATPEATNASSAAQSNLLQSRTELFKCLERIGQELDVKKVPAHPDYLYFIAKYWQNILSRLKYHN